MASRVQYSIINFQGASVAILGGTGTLGSALARRLLADQPERLILLSRDEFKQHQLGLELGQHDCLRWFLGDIRDYSRLYRALDGVDVVINTAAYKQVPAGERDPDEFIKTNVLGVMNIYNAAIERNVAKVLQIGTDKLVNPVNLYGATKLCAEKLVIASNSYVGKRRTQLSAVRYGNVANSRGSVIPIWQQHASQCTGGIPFGAPCTGLLLTDSRMTRFWISLDQAVDFVLASLDRMNGGEVFVPKLKSVRMVDVLSAVAPDCRVTVTGIRPSEKLSEILVSADELREDCGTYFRVGTGEVGPAYSSGENDEWLTCAEIRQAIN